MEKKESEKIRVLWLSDSPARNTGFAQVAKNLAKILYDTGKYDITMIGINQTDWYDRDKYPYRIFEAAPALAMNPMHRDLFGRQRLLDFLGKGTFDILFTLQDTFILEEIAGHILEARDLMRKRNKELGKEVFHEFKWIFYYPIDGKPMANWITKSALLADYPVSYTEFGKQQSIEAAKNEIPRENIQSRLDVSNELNSKIHIINHGADTKEFYPIEDQNVIDEWKKKTFQNILNGKFLIANINRNQPRKDLARTMMAFSEFYKIHPDSFLYLHCAADDAGGNLKEMARNFPNLELGKNWGMPLNFDPGIGVRIEQMNMIYNAADLIVSTTLGEGWGLSYTEAMATKTLLLAPKNTSAIEIIGKNEERGLFADCGTDISEHIFLSNDMGIMRPLTNIKSMVEKMNWAYEHKNDNESRTKIDAAYSWVKQLTWDGDNIGKKWISLFDSAYKAILKDKWIGTQKVERNEKCPCGSGKKYKNCHGK